MNIRPIRVTIIGWLLITVSAIVIAFHTMQIKPQLHSADVGIFLIQLLGIVCRAFMLRGHDWARWLALAWMGLHVCISFYGSLGAGLVHVLLFAMIAYVLLLPEANAYFRRGEAEGV